MATTSRRWNTCRPADLSSSLLYIGFHRRSDEPERGSSVVPLLRDDVQLSVEEYRNKLYDMMDEKHRKHKNMSKARVKRLSEHIRKESVPGDGTFVVGQGDVGTGKNLRSSCADLRQDKAGRINAHEHARVDGTNQMAQYAYNLSNSHLSNLPAGATKSCLYLSQQNRQLSKSQRSIQSDQVAAYGAGGKAADQSTQQPRTKLRKGCSRPTRPPAQRSFTGIVNGNVKIADTLERSLKMSLPKNQTLQRQIQLRENEDEAKQRLHSKYCTRIPSNVTRHFVKSSGGGSASSNKTGNNNNNNNDNNNSNRSPENVAGNETISYVSCRSTPQNLAIRNYLNQTMPLQTHRQQQYHHQQQHQQRQQERNSMLCQAKTNIDSRAGLRPTACKQVSRNPFASLDDRRCSNTVTSHAQLGRRQCRRSVDSAIDLVDKKRIDSIAGNGRFLDSYSQNHGVIAASAYKELRNGTVKW